MRNYGTGKPINDTLLDCKLCEAFWGKLQKLGVTFFTPQQYPILVFRDFLEQVYKRAEPDLSMADDH